MRAGRGDLVSKAGADGVQVVASRRRGQAFAIKISDGSKIAVCRRRWRCWISWAVDEGQRAERRPGAPKRSPASRGLRSVNVARCSSSKRGPSRPRGRFDYCTRPRIDAWVPGKGTSTPALTTVSPSTRSTEMLLSL